jgi:WD40 repeat protein
VDVPPFLADGPTEEINKPPFEAEAWLSSELKLWDVTTGQALHSIEGPLGMVHALAFAPNGKSIVFADGAVVEMIDTRTGQRQRTLMTVIKKRSVCELDPHGQPSHAWPKAGYDCGRWEA